MPCRQHRTGDEGALDFFLYNPGGVAVRIYSDAYPAVPLVAIVDILHDELYRKRFLPTVTDADLDGLARKALREKQSVSQ